MPRRKLVVIGVVVIAAGLVGAAGYFYNCATSHPLFSYNRPLNQEAYQYRYYFGKRLNFCRNFLFQPRSPKGPDQSVAIPIMGSQAAFRLPVDTPRPGDYNSNPPTSGWNWPSEGKYASWKTPRHRYYAEAVKPEIAVTKLYAGFVWITFKRGELSEEEWQKSGVSEKNIERFKESAKGVQRIPHEALEKLKEIAARTPLVIVSGRFGTNGGADIALNALGRQDKFNLEDGKLTPEHIQRIWDFILRYRNGPELFAENLLERAQEMEEPKLPPDE